MTATPIDESATRAAALTAATNPAAHVINAATGQVTPAVVEALASAKHDYERARGHVAAENLRAAYNRIPDASQRVAQMVLGGARIQAVQQRAAADAQALLNPAAAYAMHGDPAAVPSHLNTHAERLHAALSQMLAGPGQTVSDMARATTKE